MDIELPFKVDERVVDLFELGKSYLVLTICQLFKFNLKVLFTQSVMLLNLLLNLPSVTIVKYSEHEIQ